jgi:hypothetical protein
MSKKKTGVEAFLAFDALVEGELPHLHAFFTREEDYRGLSIKPRDDGTFLAVALGTASDGAPMVCFGQGYGVVGALMGLDHTLRAGGWKKDKFAGAGGKQSTS